MRAEAADDPGPWRQEAILGRGRWDADALRDIVRDYVVEHLADADAVLKTAIKAGLTVYDAGREAVEDAARSVREIAAEGQAELAAAGGAGAAEAGAGKERPRKPTSTP